jgi:hypothetical protein
MPPTVLTGQNVFFTGSAGTGKSFTLNKVIACLKVCAVARLLVGD